MSAESQTQELDDICPPPSYGDPDKCTDAHKSKVKDWLRKKIYILNPYNVKRLRMDFKADKFFNGRDMWLKLGTSTTGGPESLTYSQLLFEDRDDPNYIPTPTFDEFSPVIKNEAARLSKPDYRPRVPVSGVNPKLQDKEAAKISERALLHSLDEMNYEVEQDLGMHHIPMYGQWYLDSYMDYSWEKTVRIPATDALRCPEAGCDFVLSSGELADDDAQGFMKANPAKADRIDQTILGKPPTFPQLVNPGDKKVIKHSTKVCLQCDEHTVGQPPLPDVADPNMAQPGAQNVDLEAQDQGGVAAPEGMAAPQPGIADAMAPPPFKVPGPPTLVPFLPNPEEAAEGEDTFGRDLGEDVPLGEWKLETRTADQVYVSNFGIGVKPGNIKEYALLHIETLDWIRNRYENGGLVKAEPPELLMKYHPIYSDRSIYHSSPGMLMFRNCCRVREYHRDPARQLVLDDSGKPERGGDGKPTGRTYMDKGRSLILAGDVLLLDGDLMIESRTNPGKFIKRRRLDVAVGDIRSGGKELEGIGTAEREFRPQEDLNEAMSMYQDAMQMKGAPKHRVTPGMQLTFQTSPGTGGMYVWKPDPQYPTLKPEEVDNKLMSAEVWTYINWVLQHMQRVGHYGVNEQGEPPAGGVWPALGLQIMAEQSNTFRGPVIVRIREMLERQFSHGLELMHELVREAREMWMEGEDGEERQVSWKGVDIMGQTTVRVKASADDASDVVRQQRLVDFLQMGKNAAMMDDSRIRRFVADQWHLPPEPFEKWDKQDEGAQREYAAMIVKGDPMAGPIPYIDEGQDDDATHDDRHGLDMMGDEWRELEDSVGWPKAMRLLEDWQLLYEQGQTTTLPPQQDATGQMKQPMVPAQPQVDPRTGMPGPIPMDPVTGKAQMVPATATIPPFKLQFAMMPDSPTKPVCLQDRIFKVWSAMLVMRGYAPQPTDPSTPFGRVMMFRAHKAAHKKRAEDKMQAAMAGQAIQSAPGAPEGAGGALPTPTNPAGGLPRSVAA